MTRQIVSPASYRRIVALARDGRSPRAIVAELAIAGLTPSYVAQMITRARRAGRVIPYRSGGAARQRRAAAGECAAVQLTVPVAAIEYFRAAGERRGLALASIAEEILEQIARDKLADAILDDGVTT